VDIETFPVLGIALAVLAAGVLAIGNELQARGVTSVNAKTPGGAAHTLGFAQVRRLVLDRVWLLGTVFLGAAILLQLGSLTFAPLIVVQPVGVTALVFAALITAFTTKKRPSAGVIRAITICVAGVAVFVTVASLVSTQSAIGDTQLIAVLIVLGVVLLAIVALVVVSRRRHTPAIRSVIFGGVLAGFVVTLGKTVILRIQSAFADQQFALDSANVLTIVCVVGILVAGGLSIYFVQTAHTTNRPEVVVAGLTVIDPFVAVILGITILGEAQGAPWWSVLLFLAAGATAVYGVFDLSGARGSKHPADLLGHGHEPNPDPGPNNAA
jgi:drug/metabolite transporter (DMT)-like permease